MRYWNASTSAFLVKVSESTAISILVGYAAHTHVYSLRWGNKSLQLLLLENSGYPSVQVTWILTNWRRQDLDAIEIIFSAITHLLYACLLSLGRITESFILRRLPCMWASSGCISKTKCPLFCPCRRREWITSGLRMQCWVLICHWNQNPGVGRQLKGYPS